MIKILLLFVLFSGVVYADSEKIQIMFLPTADGGANIYEIDTSVYSNIPKWDVTVDNPPLSIKSALSIAREQLSSQAQEPRMKLAGVRLSSSAAVGQPPVWYYSVTLSNDAKNREYGLSEITVNILMNGDVLQPRTLSKDEYEEWLVRSLIISD